MIDKNINSYKVRKRAESINSSVLQQTDLVYRLRGLQARKQYYLTSRSYVVSLYKNKQFSLEELTNAFYYFLLNSLIENEYLNTDNRCFTISGDNYKITYCLEAYKKDANKICYIEDGEPKSDLLNRMSCEVAFKWLRKEDVDYNDAYLQVCSSTQIDKYPNPADRFVESVNRIKEFNKIFGK